MNCKQSGMLKHLRGPIGILTKKTHHGRFFIETHSFHDTFNPRPLFFRAKRNLQHRCRRPMFHFFESRELWSLAVSSVTTNLGLFKKAVNIHSHHVDIPKKNRIFYQFGRKMAIMISLNAISTYW